MLTVLKIANAFSRILNYRFSSFVSSGSENSSDSVESSATANPSHGIIEQDPFDCEEIGLSNSVSHKNNDCCLTIFRGALSYIR